MRYLINKLGMTVVVVMVALWVTEAGNALAQNGARHDVHRNRIVVAVGNNSSPLYFQDETGSLRGWMVDLWRLWSEKTGVAVDFTSGTFSETLELVKAGKADVHGGLLYTKKRDDYLDYVLPVAKMETHLFVHENILGVKGLKDLRGSELECFRGIGLRISFAAGFRLMRLLLSRPMPHCLRRCKEVKSKLLLRIQSLLWTG
ncbi:transporter substrate-binding domain-containing protein [Desulfovibrio ferrophilus]|uniref:Putative histidine kinase n=1 Tax=Desulfovibrio ferrophilus TaxID=241368 RepID=A0A2Z6AVX1_9BACT|nr:putative histidine kinase [Desulfovibrio ferrophilus]